MLKMPLQLGKGLWVKLSNFFPLFGVYLVF